MKKVVDNMEIVLYYWRVASEQATNKHSMKSTEYYINKARKLSRLPQSKNIKKKMAANHIAMGNARRADLARLISA